MFKMNNLFLLMELQSFIQQPYILSYFMFRFGSNTQKVSGKLFQMLAKPDLSVKQLFEIENIIGDIKNNITKFVQYCKKHRAFTITLIDLAFNSSIQKIDLEGLKIQTYVSTQFLSSDEDDISDLFFENDQECNNPSEPSQQQASYKKDNIISQATRLFSDDDILNEQKNQNQSQLPFEKYELLKIALKILQEPSKNQTCLGHLSKLLSFLVRKEPNNILQFFNQEQKYKKLLVNSVRYYSIANFISTMVASQDKTGQYKYENLKKQIFAGILDQFFQHCSDSEYCEGIFVFIEEVFNNTKQSYYEYFEDFKRCANVLVSKQTLAKVYDIMVHNENNESFQNTVTYLSLVMNRISSDKQNQTENINKAQKQPSMNFQIDFIVKELPVLINIIEQSRKNKKITRVSYLEFLINLLKTQKIKWQQIKTSEILGTLLQLLLSQKENGLIKVNIFLITSALIKIIKAQDLQSFITNDQNIRRFMPQQVYQSKQKYNINESNCFIVKTFILIHEKIQAKQNINNFNLEEHMIRYKTVLAKPKIQKIDSIDQTNILDFFSINKNKKQSKESVNIVKSISIPMLNIPQNQSQEQQQQKIEYQQVRRIVFNDKFQFSNKDYGQDGSQKKQDQQKFVEKNVLILNQDSTKQTKTQSKIKQIKCTKEELQFFVKHLDLC